MTTGANLDAQLGAKEETVYATAVTVDRFFPFNSESIMADRQHVVSDAILKGRLITDTEAHKLGVQKVAGSVDLDLFQENTALLFKWALGAISSTSTAGSAPFTHTITLNSTNPSFTLQKGVAHTASTSTTQPFTYAGCKINTFTFSGTKNEPAKFKFDVIGGVAETTGTSLASASYVNNAAVPFIFTEGSVTMSGASVRAESFEFNGNNHLSDDRVYAGDSITREPLREDRFEGSGKITVEFNDTTQWAYYRDGSPVVVVLRFSDGTNSAQVRFKTKLTGSTPTVQGRGITKHDFTWSRLYGDSDTDGITVTVVNSASITP